MIPGRFCRTSINTVRSLTSVANPRLSFLPPTRTCITRNTTPALRRPVFPNRNFFTTMAVNTPYVTLNDGNKMPQVGFGLWKVDNDTCADTVYNAIKTGYRLFDGACGMYASFVASPDPHCRIHSCARKSPQTFSSAPAARKPCLLEDVMASNVQWAANPKFRWL
jgi:hypothetical protein